MTSVAPLVRIIIVNHDGGQLVLRALAHVMALDWPPDRFDVVVIDNASTDGSPDEIDALFPDVQVIRNATNVGFGANNQGLSDLGPNDVAVLLNPDTAVPANLLMTLVPPLASAGPKVGAACPRIVFDRAFTEVALSPAPDHELIVTAVLDGDEDIIGECHVIGDAHRRATRQGIEWRCRSGSTLRIPEVRIREFVDGDRELQVEVCSPRSHHALLGRSTVEIGRSVQRVAVTAGATGVRVIQNDGSTIDADGTGHNRNYWTALATAPKPFKPPDAWCGAAVALRGDYLADVGGFEPKFFLYYEDTDLSWRGTAKGWRYLFVPEAIVEHRHSAITGQGSELTDELQARNRLLLLARNAPIGTTLAALGRAELSAMNQVRRAFTDRRPGTRPDFTIARRRFRAAGAAWRNLPWALRSRRR